MSFHARASVDSRPYSPRDSYLRISQQNLAMQISDSCIIEPLRKKRVSHMQQVYSSRRTSTIDKFIEEALNRGAHKDDARHSSLLQVKKLV